MSGHAGHVHGPTSGKKLWISLIVTLVFCAGEAVAGWMSHSLALVSDAAHNLSDALALGLAAYAIWIARKPASARRTFGYHRVGILTALFNAATLIAISIYIGVEAVHRLLAPETVGGSLMIWVAAIAVLMNTVIAVALSGDAKHSLNNRAAFIHMVGDAVSSFAVVIAGIVVHFTHWPYADPAASLLIGGFILYSAVGIVREAGDILLESTPGDVDVDLLIAGVKAIDPVTDVHDLHIWTVGDGLRFLSCHVALPKETTLEQCCAVTQQINKTLHDKFSIGHATIQTEVDGLCRMSDTAEMYCEMEPHAGCHHH